MLYAVTKKAFPKKFKEMDLEKFDVKGKKVKIHDISIKPVEICVVERGSQDSSIRIIGKRKSVIIKINNGLYENVDLGVLIGYIKHALPKVRFVWPE